MAAGTQGKEHGEGNYKASREYNEATKRFVESGQVDEAAREAQPHDEREARELRAAEAKGRARARDEDPEVARKSGGGQAEPRERAPQGERVTDRSADQTQTPEPGQDRS